MLDRESYILAELLGEDSPEVRALRWMARDPQKADTVRRLLRSLCLQKRIDPDDPPAFALPVGLPPSHCPVGRAKCGGILGEAVGPAGVDFMGHIGIFGSTGQGKTTLIKVLLEGFHRSGGRALILDAHGEYRDLLLRLPPGECLWLTADGLGLNPFEVPRGRDGLRVTTPEKWIGELADWVRLLWLNDPSVSFFAEVLTRLYRERGVFDGSEDYPRLSDVIAAVEREEVEPRSDRARAQEKVANRLENMRRMLPGLDVHRSRDLHRLLKHTVILDITEVKDVGLAVFFSLLVTVLSWSFRVEPTDPVRRLLAVEEAHLYFGGHTDQRTRDLREGRATGALRSLRKAGFCALLSNQLVSDLVRPVLGNLNSVICMRLTRSECINAASSLLGLARWQREELALLEPREAVARFSRYPKPIHLAVTEVPPEVLTLRVSRAEAAERSKTLLEAVPFEVKTEPDQEEDAPLPEQSQVPQHKASSAKRGCRVCAELGLQLSRTDHRVMEAICEKPAENIVERCDRLQMRREREAPARRRLEALGLVRYVGSVGNRRALFEPTALGRRWAREHGIRLPRYHGGLIHEYCTRLAEKKLSRAAPGTRFHRRDTGQPNGVRPDSLAVLPGREGARIAIQTVVGHNPRDEARNLLKLQQVQREQAAQEGRLPLLDLVVCVAVNKRVEAAVQRELLSQTGGSHPYGVVLLNVEEHLLEPAFDWTTVLEREI